MKVLIGEISSYKAIVIARHIFKMYPEVELIAYDNKRPIRRIHTKYVSSCVYIEKTDLVSYIQKLADFVNSQGIDVFIPVHSDYIGQILYHKEIFGNALDYLGNYYDYISLHEKNQLMNIARKSAVRVPKCYKTIESAQVPFVVKPTNKSSAKGVHYCMTESDKEKFISETNNDLSHSLCQEYIAGQGCGYSIYCKDGQIMQEYGHIRLAEYPISGGSSVYRKGFIHSDMKAVAEKILKKVSWTGFAMFEFKLTELGELVLIEVNPRIWGSINQALEEGIPFFSNLLWKEQKPVRQKSNSPKRTCLSPQVYLSLLLYALKGNVAPLKDFVAHRKFVSKDVSLLKDPKGFVSMIIRKL